MASVSLSLVPYETCTIEIEPIPCTIGIECYIHSFAITIERECSVSVSIVLDSLAMLTINNRRKRTIQ